VRVLLMFASGVQKYLFAVPQSLLCHPFASLRAGSERVGPVKCVAARIQRRACPEPVEGGLVARWDPLRFHSGHASLDSRRCERL